MIALPNQTIYQCSYCGRRFLSRSSFQRHERLYCSSLDSPRAKAVLEGKIECTHSWERYQDYKVCRICGAEVDYELGRPIL